MEREYKFRRFTDEDYENSFSYSSFLKSPWLLLHIHDSLWILISGSQDLYIFDFLG